MSQHIKTVWNYIKIFWWNQVRPSLSRYCWELWRSAIFFRFDRHLRYSCREGFTQTSSFSAHHNLKPGCMCGMSVHYQIWRETWHTFEWWTWYFFVSALVQLPSSRCYSTPSTTGQREPHWKGHELCGSFETLVNKCRLFGWFLSSHKVARIIQSFGRTGWVTSNRKNMFKANI